MFRTTNQWWYMWLYSKSNYSLIKFDPWLNGAMLILTFLTSTWSMRLRLLFDWINGGLHDVHANILLMGFMGVHWNSGNNTSWDIMGLSWNCDADTNHHLYTKVSTCVHSLVHRILQWGNHGASRTIQFQYMFFNTYWSLSIVYPISTVSLWLIR